MIRSYLTDTHFSMFIGIIYFNHCNRSCFIISAFSQLNSVILSENAINENQVTYTIGQRGCTLLVFKGFNYVRNRRSGMKTYWICAKKGSTKCNARVVTNVIDGVQKIVLESCIHNHNQNVARKKRSVALIARDTPKAKDKKWEIKKFIAVRRTHKNNELLELESDIKPIVENDFASTEPLNCHLC